MVRGRPYGGNRPGGAAVYSIGTMTYGRRIPIRRLPEARRSGNSGHGERDAAICSGEGNPSLASALPTERGVADAGARVAS
jgi:hypothetical protein